MAILISTQTKENYGIKIINYYREDDKLKSESTTLFEDDEVEDFKFIKDGEVATLSGKLKKINHFFKQASINLNTDDNFIQRDAVIDNVVIDHSSENNSAVDVIDGKDILDYGTEKSIEKVTTVPVITVDFKSILSDSTSSETTFYLGQYLFNVKYIFGKKEITGDFKVNNFSYSINEYGKAKMNGLVLVSDDSNLKVVVPFDAIKSCGNEGLVVESSEDVAEALEKAMSDPTVGGVVLKALEYTPDITASTININGNKMNESAFSGERCNDETLASETVLKGKLTCSANSDVKIIGVTFNEGSEISTTGAKSVAFKNCRFVGATPTKAKSYYVTADAAETPVLYTFENCYFGTNPDAGTKKMYNLFELNSKIATGSYIKNCYFGKDVCNHNIINIYDVEDGAVIDIVNNIFEMSRNAIRVGIKGNKEATINIVNNTYNETDETVEYGGLVLVQPYAKATDSFENVTINLNDTINKTDNDQIIYLYCGSGDTQITAETQPKVYINKKLTSLI